MFKRVLAERKVEVYNNKEVVDVRDPPQDEDEASGAGGQGTLVCDDGTEVSFPLSDIHPHNPKWGRRGNAEGTRRGEEEGSGERGRGGGGALYGESLCRRSREPRLGGFPNMMA